jgi:uncharacterized protein YuzE
MAEIVVEEILGAVPFLRKSGSQHLSFDFDEQADVLYVSLEKPQMATDTDPMDDQTLLRYSEDRLVGITLLNMSKRFGNEQNQ